MGQVKEGRTKLDTKERSEANHFAFGFHANGAYGWKPKITTMYEELRRRLLHMDTLYSKAEKEEVVRDFIDSGYKHKTRKEIILSAVRKYYCQILEQETGGRQLYRSGKEMVESRRMKSLQNKTWF